MGARFENSYPLSCFCIYTLKKPVTIIFHDNGISMYKNSVDEDELTSRNITLQLF